MTTEPTKNRLCQQPETTPRIFHPGVSPQRISFILTSSLKWVNGTEIKYMFLDELGGRNDMFIGQKEVIRKAFAIWKSLGIGISFKEVSAIGDSMVRIGFDWKDGSWSYVGRDILTISSTEKTMNFGWDLTQGSYGMTTALHEIGHTIGFQHEHQSPFAGIEWNTPAVYAAFSDAPNYWPKAQIDNNILRKLPANQVKGSAWDPKSIMQYEFGPGLVVRPAPYAKGIFPPGILSAGDIEGVKAFYPAVAGKKIVKLKVNESAVILSTSGGQDDFIFTAPSTKKYSFQTVGEMDTVMVISEKAKAENYYLSGDDDSGLDQNSKITLPLVKGRTYFVNIRIMYKPGEDGAVIVY